MEAKLRPEPGSTGWDPNLDDMQLLFGSKVDSTAKVQRFSCERPEAQQWRCKVVFNVFLSDPTKPGMFGRHGLFERTVSGIFRVQNGRFDIFGDLALLDQHAI